MRVLAIGDIHGCSTAFDALLDAVTLQPDDKIITLGDYVDRGPDSKGILDRLIELYDTGRLVALRGNHEIMMLGAFQKRSLESPWRRGGGDKTLASYSRSGDGSFADVPDEHWLFLERACVDWYETDGHFFVHAGAYPDMPLSEQPDYMLFWAVFEEVAPHVSGKIMVCGHTTQTSGLPSYLGYAICIDTGVEKGGWLTCLDVNSGRIWQADEAGKVRKGWVN